MHHPFPHKYMSKNSFICLHPHPPFQNLPFGLKHSCASWNTCSFNIIAQVYLIFSTCWGLIYTITLPIEVIGSNLIDDYSF